MSSISTPSRSAPPSAIPPLRFRLFIDRQVQGTLLIRAGLYAATALLYVSCVLLFSQVMSEPERTWAQHFVAFADDAMYWMSGLLVLVPLLGYDVLKMSHRFAGPVFRLRTEMEKLVQGDAGREMQFRDEDQWTELSALYNELRSELLQLRSQAASPHTSLGHSPSGRVERQRGEGGEEV